MPVALETEVEHDLDRLVDAGVAAIVSATETMASQLRTEHIPDEAPVGATGALSDPSNWSEHVVDRLTRIVRADTDAWYAHIVARGRSAVEPIRARALSVEGAFVARVGPVAPNPFHERALERLEARTADILADALAEQGI